MYEIEKIYGPVAYRTFQKEKAFKGKSLKGTRRSSKEVSRDDPLTVNSYKDLIEIVSFLSVMNKRYTLYFRGQGRTSLFGLPSSVRVGYRWAAPNTRFLKNRKPEGPYGIVSAVKSLL
jgi:hypothetical protein